MQPEIAGKIMPRDNLERECREGMQKRDCRKRMQKDNVERDFSKIMQKENVERECKMRM